MKSQEKIFTTVVRCCNDCPELIPFHRGPYCKKIYEILKQFYPDEFKDSDPRFLRINDQRQQISVGDTIYGDAGDSLERIDPKCPLPNN